MKTLIIYDEIGYIISIMQSTTPLRKPVGVSSIEVILPEGKQIKIVDGIGVNVEVDPHELMLEDIPKSELETLQEVVADLAEILLLGGM